jgi:hypothetical protein
MKQPMAEIWPPASTSIKNGGNPRHTKNVILGGKSTSRRINLIAARYRAIEISIQIRNASQSGK